MRLIWATLTLVSLVNASKLPQKRQQNLNDFLEANHDGKWRPEELDGRLGFYIPDYRGKYIHVHIPYIGGYGDSGIPYVHVHFPYTGGYGDSGISYIGGYGDDGLPYYGGFGDRGVEYNGGYGDNGNRYAEKHGGTGTIVEYIPMDDKKGVYIHVDPTAGKYIHFEGNITISHKNSNSIKEGKGATGVEGGKGGFGGNGISDNLFGKINNDNNDPKNILNSFHFGGGKPGKIGSSGKNGLGNSEGIQGSGNLLGLTDRKGSSGLGGRGGPLGPFKDENSKNSFSYPGRGGSPRLGGKNGPHGSVGLGEFQGNGGIPKPGNLISSNENLKRVSDLGPGDSRKGSNESKRRLGSLDPNRTIKPSEQGISNKFSGSGNSKTLDGFRGFSGQPSLEGSLGQQGPSGRPAQRGPGGQTGQGKPKSQPGQTGPGGAAGQQVLGGPPGKIGHDGLPSPVKPGDLPGQSGPSSPLAQEGPGSPTGQRKPNGSPGQVGPGGPLGEVGPGGPHGRVGPGGSPGRVGLGGPPGQVGPGGPPGKVGPSGPPGAGVPFSSFADKTRAPTDIGNVGLNFKGGNKDTGIGGGLGTPGVGRGDGPGGRGRFGPVANKVFKDKGGVNRFENLNNDISSLGPGSRDHQNKIQKNYDGTKSNGPVHFNLGDETITNGNRFPTSVKQVGTGLRRGESKDSNIGGYKGSSPSLLGHNAGGIQNGYPGINKQLETKAGVGKGAGNLDRGFGLRDQQRGSGNMHATPEIGRRKDDQSTGKERVQSYPSLGINTGLRVGSEDGLGGTGGGSNYGNHQIGSSKSHDNPDIGRGKDTNHFTSPQKGKSKGVNGIVRGSLITKNQRGNAERHAYPDSGNRSENPNLGLENNRRIPGGRDRGVKGNGYQDIRKQVQIGSGKEKGVGGKSRDNQIGSRTHFISGFQDTEGGGGTPDQKKIPGRGQDLVNSNKYTTNRSHTISDPKSFEGGKVKTNNPDGFKNISNSRVSEPGKGSIPSRSNFGAPVSGVGNHHIGKHVQGGGNRHSNVDVGNTFLGKESENGHTNREGNPLGIGIIVSSGNSGDRVFSKVSQTVGNRTKISKPNESGAASDDKNKRPLSSPNLKVIGRRPSDRQNYDQKKISVGSFGNGSKEKQGFDRDQLNSKKTPSSSTSSEGSRKTRPSSEIDKNYSGEKKPVLGERSGKDSVTSGKNLEKDSFQKTNNISNTTTYKPDFITAKNFKGPDYLPPLNQNKTSKVIINTNKNQEHSSAQPTKKTSIVKATDRPDLHKTKPASTQNIFVATTVRPFAGPTYLPNPIDNIAITQLSNPVKTTMKPNLSVSRKTTSVNIKNPIITTTHNPSRTMAPSSFTTLPKIHTVKPFDIKTTTNKPFVGPTYLPKIDDDFTDVNPIIKPSFKLTTVSPFKGPTYLPLETTTFKSVSNKFTTPKPPFRAPTYLPPF